MVKKETVIKIPPGATLKISSDEEKDQKDLAKSSSDASHQQGSSLTKKQESKHDGVKQSNSASTANVSSSTAQSKGTSSSEIKSTTEESNDVSLSESKEGLNNNKTIKIKIKHEYKHK